MLHLVMLISTQYVVKIALNKSINIPKLLHIFSLNILSYLSTTCTTCVQLSDNGPVGSILVHVYLVVKYTAAI